MPLLRFSFGEAFASLRRGWRSTAFAVLTVAGASFILALLLWVGQVATGALDRWAAVAEVSVYVSPRAPEAAVTNLRRLLEAHPAVASAEYVSAEAARLRLLSDFPDARGIVGDMTTAHVPASFEVRLHTGRPSDEVQTLADDVRRMTGVEDVRYDRDLIERVMAAVGVLRAVGGVLGLLLLLTCAMTVTSVVKLAYESRRDEVEILYLVGAPARAIRGPFAAEGFILAMAGAMTALSVLVVSVWVIEHQYAGLLLTTFGAAALPRPGWTTALVLLAAVALLGLLSGLIASGGGDGRRAWPSANAPIEPESTPSAQESVVAEGPVGESDR